MTDRAALRPLLASLLVTAAATVAYFELPFSSTGTGLAVLLPGLAVVSGLLVWHVYGILRSPYPRIRGVAALATTVPLFLLVFATTYYLMERDVAGSFTETLDRLDAIYFAVTVFATVGFGDITPVTAAARAVTTVQMIGDLALVGLVAQVIVGAVRQGVRRVEETRSGRADTTQGATAVRRRTTRRKTVQR